MSRKRIIIADDSGTARMFVRRCLEIVGFADYEFVEVTDGEAAIKSLDGSLPDLIVTDLFMHPMDGTELLRKLKASPSWRAVPVIVATSAKNAAKEEELLTLGAVAVLSKPISPAAMMDALQKIPDEGSR